MMLKIFAILILVLVIMITILILMVKQKNKTIKNLESENDTFRNSYDELNDSYKKLHEEMEIEKKHNQELAEKLADISCMPINDVLAQLQNNKDSKKDNNLHS